LEATGAPAQRGPDCYGKRGEGPDQNTKTGPNSHAVESARLVKQALSVHP